jgi:hypothetical protein
MLFRRRLPLHAYSWVRRLYAAHAGDVAYTAKPSSNSNASASFADANDRQLRAQQAHQYAEEPESFRRRILSISAWQLHGNSPLWKAPLFGRSHVNAIKNGASFMKRFAGCVVLSFFKRIIR